MSSTTTAAVKARTQSTKPKLGFIGTGWIGQLRLRELVALDCAHLHSVFDSSQAAAQSAAAIAPDIDVVGSLQELLAGDIDGVVIATPSALHAQHAEQALNCAKAVFCQKPLGCNAAETRSVVSAARAADQLLSVDFCYRYLDGIRQLRDLIKSGEIGEIFSVELVFHNAYGPDKPWFYDFALSGGGCVMDLGIHLIDIVLWILNSRAPVTELTHVLYKQGKRIQQPVTEVEDYARVCFSQGNTAVQLSCSWNLHAGQDAVISMNFHGTRGGAAIHNVNGSFFDFETFLYRGTQRQQLAGYPEDWGGRALCAWIADLAADKGFNADAEHTILVAQVIDEVYQR